MPSTRTGGTARRGRATASSSVRVTQEPLPVTRRPAASHGPSRHHEQGHEGSGNRSILGDVSVLYSQTNEDRTSDMMMFFVLGEGLTKATCSPYLTSVYTLLKDKGIVCRWMENKDCLKHTPVYGNIFVMDPFEGLAYDRLASFMKKGECGVLGPQAVAFLVTDCQCTLELGKYPIYHFSMSNMLICLAGMTTTPPEKKNELVKKIKQMAGNPLSALTRGTTHVVTSNVLSEKSWSAQNMGLPVLTEKWVDAVWEAGSKELLHATNERFTEYCCPTFYNLTICLSQITPDLKIALRNAIEANGGKYSGDLMKNMTSLLVVPSAEGQKYEHAKNWKLPCVTPSWVEASKAAGYAVNWRDHAVGGASNSSRSTTNQSVVVESEAERKRHNSNNSRKKTSTPINSMIVPLCSLGFNENDSVVSNIGGASDQVDFDVNTDLPSIVLEGNGERDPDDQGEEHDLPHVNGPNTLVNKDVDATPDLELDHPIAVNDANLNHTHAPVPEERLDLEGHGSNNNSSTFSDKGDMWHAPIQLFPGIENIMPGVVIAVSQYNKTEKDRLAELVQAMGGKFQDVFARKTSREALRSTHLICSKIDNPKYRFAMKWNVPVVLAEWVFDSYNAKELQPVEKYDPLEMPDSQTSTVNIPATPGIMRSERQPSRLPATAEKPSPVSRFSKNLNGRAQSPMRTPVRAGNDDPVFKTPASRDSRRQSNGDLNESSNSYLNHSSFIEYYRTHGTPDVANSPSYIAWKAQQPKTPEESEGEESIINGLTRKQWELDREPPLLIQALNNPNRPMMTIPKWPPFDIDQYYQCDLPPIEPYEPGTSAAGVSSYPELNEKSGNERRSSKRSSDSSGDDEIAGPSTRARRNKRLRSSDESEKDMENCHPDNPQVNAETNGAQQAEVEEQIEPADRSRNRAPDSPRSEANSTVSSTDGDGDRREGLRNGSRLLKLKSLLANVEDRDAQRPKSAAKAPQIVEQTVSSDPEEGEEDQDRPHVVWENNQNQEDQGSSNVSGVSPSSPSRASAEDSLEQTPGDIDSASASAVDEEESDFVVDVPANPGFILSGLSDEERKTLTKSLTQLGGRVIDNTFYDPSSFAIVANNLARSEKVLCSIAEGKPLLSSAYVNASKEAGHFLSITDEYLWNEAMCRKDVEKSIARASYIWLQRIAIDESDRPFKAMTFYLNVAEKMKPAYTRLIKAGNGTVVEDREDATIIIRDGKSKNSTETDENGIPIKEAFYLNQLILNVEYSSRD